MPLITGSSSSMVPASNVIWCLPFFNSGSPWLMSMVLMSCPLSFNSFICFDVSRRIVRPFLTEAGMLTLRKLSISISISFTTAESSTATRRWRGWASQAFVNSHFDWVGSPGWGSFFVWENLNFSKLWNFHRSVPAFSRLKSASGFFSLVLC